MDRAMSACAWHGAGTHGAFHVALVALLVAADLWVCTLL